jgi:hypothetical protein
MTRRPFVLCFALALAAALVAAGCKTTPPEDAGAKSKPEPTGPHASLLKLFPSDQDIGDWKAAGAAAVFGPEARTSDGVQPLEADIGPAAATIRAYDYVKSAARKYARGAGAETVTVRLFEMKNPSEAFGVFSVATDGAQFPMIGLAARMGNTVLGFVQGPYFALVEYQGTSEATASILLEFGRWIAEHITSPGYRPSLLEMFPLASIQGERYYLHQFSTLAMLPFVPKGDAATMSRMLALGPKTDVAVMGYPTETPGAVNYLFLIHYPTEADAQAAYAAYTGYLDSSTNPAEHDVAVAPPVGAYLAGTFNAEENSLRDQLAKLLAGLKG